MLFVPSLLQCSCHPHSECALIRCWNGSSWLYRLQISGVLGLVIRALVNTLVHWQIKKMNSFICGQMALQLQVFIDIYHRFVLISLLKPHWHTCLWLLLSSAPLNFFFGFCIFQKPGATKQLSACAFITRAAKWLAKLGNVNDRARQPKNNVKMGMVAI